MTSSKPLKYPRFRRAFALALLSSACTSSTAPECIPASGTPSFDAYGGDARVSLASTGFFRTEKHCERWWFVTPDGHPFYSMGINSIEPYGSVGVESGKAVYAETVATAYESQDAWVDAAVTRM